MQITENRRVPDHREDALQNWTRPPLVCVILLGRASGVTRLAMENLEHEGFSVRTLPMGTDLVPRVDQVHPSLIIIEATQWRGRSLELCRGIRKVQSMAQTPIILVATKTSEEERILGLESGADDVISESSSGREVVARVRALIRRFARQELQSLMPHILPPFLHPSIGTPGPTIRTGDIEIDPTAMRISVRGSEVATTNLEFRLLYYLVHNQARVFSRDQLLDAVWGTQYVELRSVDACVRRLRRKIEPDPLRPTYLKTVRGAGYRLTVGIAGTV